MATQSLYRRYRPRRFAELKGQDHVVRALRTSVAEGREGQAYLFSGPRGTGKTTSARILAKVLNCENPQDGEPCCECASCLSVEQGTSYDVHELDAASNNGVDAMRDLIEKASLGTPGRHKVYILDEVHMLSKGAEAALLKTLEEPPPHVVFVLATTDPQKMSDTIRSRTQHLQFHLLPVDTLEEHVKWVAEEAGLSVTDAAIEQVIAQGAGSARDTLSALELVANTGGDAAEVLAVDEFVEAMIEHDPGRALTMAAQAISRGRDPRTLTEELIAFLRNGFLSLMAPDLVQLPTARIDVLTEQARRLGPAGLVRGIEQLGAALTEMRHAPDPRVLLDVAIVRLTSEQVAGDLASVVDRLTRLERRVADGVPAGAPAAAAAAPVTPAAAAAADPAPADPATGRKALGGRVRKAADPAPTPDPAPIPAADPSDAPTGSESPADDDAHPSAPTAVSADDAASSESGAPSAATAPTAVSADDAASSESGAPSAATAPTAVSADDAASSESGAPSAATAPPADVSPAPEPESAAPSGGELTAADWERAKSGLKGMARAVFSPAEFVRAVDGVITLGLPNDTHRQKCEQHRPAAEQALSDAASRPVSVELVTGGGAGGGGGRGAGPSGGGGQVAPASNTAAAPSAPGGPSARGPVGAVGSSMSAAVAPDAVPMTSDPDDTPHLQPVPDLESVPAPSADDAASDGLEAPGPAVDTATDTAIDTAIDVASSEPTAASGRAIAEAARAAGEPSEADVLPAAALADLPDDDDIDLDDLVDAPPEAVRTPMDRLADAFPGSELVDDVY